MQNDCLIRAYVNQSINQSKPVTLRRRWGVPTDASAVMGTRRCLSSATRSNDHIDWPVHSLMLSIHDLRGLPLRRLPSTEYWSMIFGDNVPTDEQNVKYP